MNRKRPLEIFQTLFSSLLLFGCVQADEPVQQSSLSHNAAFAWYTHYCSGCHGGTMEGGSAGSLIDNEWEWGSSREDITRSIAIGDHDLGMPGYGETMTDMQVAQIVDLIKSKKVPEIKQESLTPGDTIQTLDYLVGVDDWVSGVETPWHLEFVTDTVALMTEKGGGIRVIDNGRLGQRVKNTPPVTSGGQGGMLAVNVDPEFKTNRWVYLAYSHILDSQSSKTMTRVVRGRIVDNAWQDQETIWQAEDRHYTNTRHHYGTRIQFGPDGMLYFSIGDRGRQNRAQDIGDPAGKMHRIHPDGSIPEDNPFVNEEGAIKSVWSYGLRNSQGFDFHPVTSQLWEAEHGPRGGDEVNILEPAKNYGWPEITYGINYNGSIITKERVRPGLEQPVWVWRPSIAVCGIEFYEGNQFPFWTNHLMVASLANQTVRLMQIQDERIIHEEVIIRDRGRIRHVTQDSQGAVYVVLNNPDKVIRLTAIREDPQ